jgi:hypothetical protein
MDHRAMALWNEATGKIEQHPGLALSHYLYGPSCQKFHSYFKIIE